MRFLNRVHFDSPMYPLELEMFHQIRNVIGVDPQLYEVSFVAELVASDPEAEFARVLTVHARH